MKQVNNIVLAAGLLAELACAQHHHNHRHLHHARAEVTDVVVETVVKTVTATSTPAHDFVKHQYSFPWHKSKTSSAGASTMSSSAEATSASTESSYAASSTKASSTKASSSEASPTEASSSSSLSGYSSSASSSASSASSYASSSASSTASSATSSSTGLSGNPYTSNGLKAGLSGYVGIQNTAGFTSLSSVIGWYSDYSAITPTVGNVEGIPMLWNDGTSCSSYSEDETSETSRFSDFQSAVATSTPSIMFGFYEPDCDCYMSSEMDTATGTANWNEYLAPLASKGTVLGSPPPCAQADESWLTPFSMKDYPSDNTSILDAPWAITSVHVNVKNLSMVEHVVNHFIDKYQKPVWVSELACVDSGPTWFTPCSDQGEIDDFINDAIPWLQSNPNVVAYGPSNGEGLGTTWPLFDQSTGELSATGTTYLDAIKALL